jgi:hypothetical protein
VSLRTRRNGGGIPRWPKTGTFDESGRKPVATYELVYGDDEQVVDETLENIDHVEREDGWVVLFRGPEAILRVQESHVKSMELLD